MEGSTKDKPSPSVSGSGSRLRYPLRSSLKSMEVKPPVPEFSASSSRRGRNASAVSQSVGVLDLSSKGKPSKPPRRLSNPTKSATNSATKPSCNITPISEARSKRSTPGPSKNGNVAPSSSRSVSQRKTGDLSSASYWLTHIKVSESAGKHMISLGFFKLAFEAGCEPLQRMRDELKSYTNRHNLSEVEDTVKSLIEIYNISEHLDQLQISETSSQGPEEGTQTSDKGVQKNPSAEADEKVCQGPEEGTQTSDNGVQNYPSAVAEKKVEPKAAKSETVRSSRATRSAKKEVTPKNDQLPKSRRSLSKSSANSRTTPGNSGRKLQKKGEKIAKSDQEKQKTNKQGKKEPFPEEGQEKASLEQNVEEENKENADVPQAEEIVTAQA